jgi:hypothetical protein
MRDDGASGPPGSAATPVPEGRPCAWCATPAADDATTCGSCGAALAQRESFGDVRIPGLTSVDPALEDYASRPMHLRGPSSSQGVAPGLIVGAAAGGPIGAVLIGGVVAVAAAEYLGARQPGTGAAALGEVGKPSELALKALEHSKDADAARSSAPELTPASAPDALDARDPEIPDAAAAEGGMSIWRDLPAQPPE